MKKAELMIDFGEISCKTPTNYKTVDDLIRSASTTDDGDTILTGVNEANIFFKGVALPITINRSATIHYLRSEKYVIDGKLIPELETDIAIEIYDAEGKEVEFRYAIPGCSWKD